MTNNTITFELNGKTYIDTNNNRFYVVEDGKKTRIGREAYTKAFDQYIGLAKAQIEEQETTTEIEQVSKELAPKKRVRKSKDIAYEGHEVTLTAKQVDFIRHLPDTCFWENGLDSCIWTDCLCDDIGGQFKDKPMTVGAMISTICEKGLANRGTDDTRGRKSTILRLTELGKKVAAELGLS